MNKKIIERVPQDLPDNFFEGDYWDILGRAQYLKGKFGEEFHVEHDSGIGYYVRYFKVETDKEYILRLEKELKVENLKDGDHI